MGSRQFYPQASNLNNPVADQATHLAQLWNLALRDKLPSAFTHHHPLPVIGQTYTAPADRIRL
jgi:hypothetical protein